MTVGRRIRREPDMVNDPPHYQHHPSGVEIIEVAETLEHRIATAFAYVERSPFKGTEIEDLKKAQWYLNRYQSNPSPVSFSTDRFLAFEPDVSLSRSIIQGDVTGALAMIEGRIRKLERG